MNIVDFLDQKKDEEYQIKYLTTLGEFLMLTPLRSLRKGNLEIMYVVFKTPSEFKVGFQIRDLGVKIMYAEEFARSRGYEILYRGEVSNPKEAEVVGNVVMKANEEGEFNPVLLEEKILALQEIRKTAERMENEIVLSI